MHFSFCYYRSWIIDFKSPEEIIAEQEKLNTAIIVATSDAAAVAVAPQFPTPHAESKTDVGSVAASTPTLAPNDAPISIQPSTSIVMSNEAAPSSIQKSNEAAPTSIVMSNEAVPVSINKPSETAPTPMSITNEAAPATISTFSEEVKAIQQAELDRYIEASMQVDSQRKMLAEFH